MKRYSKFKVNYVNQNFKHFFYSLAFVFILFVIQLIGLSSLFFSYIDFLLKPFSLNLRQFSKEIIYLNKFLFSANSLINENLELKEKLIKNEVNLKQLSELNNLIITESNFKNNSNFNFKGVINYIYYPIGRISGIKNLYSNDPIFKIYLNNEVIPQKDDIVLVYDSVLLGFVLEVKGNTAIVAPFYSAFILNQISIPVYNLRDNSIKGLISPIKAGELFIKNVPTNKEIREGDLWLTSNEALEVPSGLIVGKTKKVIQNKDTGFNEVQIDLIFDPNDLNLVYLIRG